VLPWRYARQLVGIEPDRQPRHDLDDAIRGAPVAFARLRLDRIKASRRQIAEVGQYGLPEDELGFWAHTRGVAVEEISKLADWVARSFCAPIGVPDEIVPVLAPRGGVADFSALLELLGQGERYAYADRSQSIAYRRLGDQSVTESYGLLFARLLEQPEWLAIR